MSDYSYDELEEVCSMWKQRALAACDALGMEPLDFDYVQAVKHYVDTRVAAEQARRATPLSPQEEAVWFLYHAGEAGVVESTCLLRAPSGAIVSEHAEVCSVPNEAVDPKTNEPFRVKLEHIQVYWRVIPRSRPDDALSGARNKLVQAFRVADLMDKGPLLDIQKEGLAEIRDNLRAVIDSLDEHNKAQSTRARVPR